MNINKYKLPISINIAHGMGKYLFIGISVFLAFSAVRAEAKQLLTQSDFTYIGAFLMPASSGSGDATFGRGLAHRYVNGELRMFSTSWNPQDVYEVRVPTLSVIGGIFTTVSGSLTVAPQKYSVFIGMMPIRGYIGHMVTYIIPTEVMILLLVIAR
jgi:hypothetical protein